MKDFVITIICAAVASGVINLFFSDNAQISKYIRLVLSVCFICAIIPGTRQFISNITVPDIKSDYDFSIKNIEFDQLYEKNVIENARISLCEQMKKMIFENTGINVSDLDIQFNVTESEDEIAVGISGVTVELQDQEKVDAVGDYVEQICGVYPKMLMCETG